MDDSDNPDGRSGPANDSVRQLRQDLRDYSDHSLDWLADKAHISKSSVWNITRDIDELPSRKMFEQFVRTHMGDAAEDWLARYDNLARQLKTSVEDPSTPSPGDSKAPRRWWTARPPYSPVALGAVAFAAAAAAVVIAVSLPDEPTPTPTPTSPSAANRIVVQDGDNPDTAGCATRSTRIKSEPVPDVGFVTLVYSADCNSFWARAQRNDGAELDNHVLVTLTPDDGRRPSAADEPDAEVSFTLLLTDPDRGTYCASATFYTGDSEQTAEACGKAP